MQALLGTENLNTAASLQGEVRRCRGGSTKAAVDVRDQGDVARRPREVRLREDRAAQARLGGQRRFGAVIRGAIALVAHRRRDTREREPDQIVAIAGPPATRS